MMLVLYLVSPCPLASVCLFTVFSYRYRIIVIVTDIPKYCRYGISYRIVSKRYIRNVRYDIHHKRSYPPIFRLHSHHFLVNFSGCPCIASVQITQTGIHCAMPSGVGNDTHHATSQFGPTASRCVLAFGRVGSPPSIKYQAFWVDFSRALPYRTYAIRTHSFRFRMDNSSAL